MSRFLHHYILYLEVLGTGSIPGDWRRANILPVHKNSPDYIVGNYCTVSVTSQICKVFEAVITDATVNHLKQYKFILDTQHGFLDSHSYLTNLLVSLDQVTKYVDQG